MADPSVRLDRNTAAPLHRQVADRLLELASTTSDGERLPPEHELMSRFDVSRTTIRRATASLIEQGFLERAHGKGTFVRHHPVTHSLDSLSPFFAVLEAAGRPPETELVEFGWERGRVVPEQLSTAGSRALGYRRRYRTDGRVHAVLHVQIAEPYGVGLTAAQFENTPVLHVLERQHGIVLRNARYTIRTMNADAELAALIELPEGTGLLTLTRSTSTPDGRPVEMTTHYLDPAVYELSVTIDENSRPSLYPTLSLSHGSLPTKPGGHDVD